MLRARIRVAAYLVAASAVAGSGAATALPVVFQASGPNAASIQSNVDAFRAALGDPSNGNGPPTNGVGRREITWDGANDAVAAPNPLPPDFFNTTAPRGAVLSGAASFQQSADSSNPTSTPIEFGNLDPSYPDDFVTFSSPRLFAPIGSNQFTVSFFVPGTTIPGTVSGFGAVFTDVDTDFSSSIGFFDVDGNLLFTKAVPASVDDEGLSFLGVFFDAGERVRRVDIQAGDAILGAGVLDNPTGGVDVVALDDFIYGEPVPEPASLSLLGLGMLALAARRRSKR